MANIAVDINKTQIVLADQDALVQTLNGICKEMVSIRGSLRYKITAYEAIAQRIGTVEDQIRREQDAVKSLRSGLERIAQRYEQAENTNIMGIKTVSIEWSNGALEGAAISSTQDQESIPEVPQWVSYILDIIKDVIIGSPKAIPWLGAILGLMTKPAVLYSGLDVSAHGRTGPYADFLGYEVADGHPGVTAWIGKAGDKIENDWSSTEVNAYLGKVENEAKFELSFFNKEEKKKKQNAKSDWEDDPKPTDYISGVVSVGSSVSVAGIEYNNDVGNDILGAGVDAEGSVLNADLKAKGELSVSKDGVDALVSGKAMVTAAEGKASGTINILGIEIKGTIGGYAGGLGVEGKVGIEDNHFVLEGGFAALLGLSGGIEVGFNDEGWSRVWDVISFWD